MGSRAVGLVGTLVITRFVAPAEYGGVTVAAVLAMTANQLSSLGLGQYLVARPDAPRSVAFHVTSLHVSFGVVALAVLSLCGGWLGALFDAPGMAGYLPGLVLAALLDRVAFVPERMLVRNLRFRRLSLARMPSVSLAVLPRPRAWHTSLARIPPVVVANTARIFW